MRKLSETIRNSFWVLQVDKEQRFLVGQSIVVGVIVWIAIA